MRNSVKTGLLVVGAFVGGVYVGYSKAREIVFEAMAKAALDKLNKVQKSDKEDEAE